VAAYIANKVVYIIKSTTNQSADMVAAVHLSKMSRLRRKNFASLGLEQRYFSNTYRSISQGSVETRLSCGGIFTDDFITNLLVGPSLKEF